MSLSAYHQKYAKNLDEEIQKRADEKKEELTAIFQHIPLQTLDKVVRVAVIGCGDKRFIKHHKQIFEDLLKKPVEITTFDISIEHLAGEEKVVEHDCTLPLPGGPFDITFGHVVLRFMETSKQWDLIKNSYEALKPGGLAIHLLDKEDYETKEERISNGLFSVPLENWKSKFDEMGVMWREVPVKYGVAWVILK